MGLSVGVCMVLGTVDTLLAEAVGSDEEFQDVIRDRRARSATALPHRGGTGHGRALRTDLLPPCSG